MSDQEIKLKVGELILEGQLIKLRAEGVLKKRGLSEGHALIGVAVIIALFVMMVLTLVFNCRNAHALDCSWYSEAALRRDGQDKITHFQMANGEYFNDDLMVVAARCVPLNSVVRITNPKNGRSVVAVVKDRIARRFATTRIDASPRVFSALADLKSGVIKNIMIEVL